MPCRLFCVSVLKLLSLVAVSTAIVEQCAADTFQYIDREGNRQQVEASLYGAGDGAIALQKFDGSIELLPDAAVQKRVPGPKPSPITPDEMLERLKQEFGEEKFRGRVEGQYVIGAVLMAPLPKQSERRAQGNLLRSARYMKSIEQIFRRFCLNLKVEVQEPEYPLVVLIFETDEDFEEYATRHTGGRGLSAGSVAGFYSQLTNFLYVRMSECYTFGTPLHEAIHQQCFNTGVLKRFAPIPVWFAEGMATGFEGSGDRVRSDPQKLNAVYAKLLVEAGRLPPGMDWSDVVMEDAVFRGDIFAGQAYIHAWALHWLLVTKHRDGYGPYLKRMQALDPFAQVSQRDRAQAFQECFESSPEEIRRGFEDAFNSAIKRAKLRPDPETQPGLLSKQLNLAHVEVYVESRGQVTNVQAQLRNISPLREMAYYVTVLTDSGANTSWYLPKVRINQRLKLDPKAVSGLGPSRRFAVEVRATPADSEENARWQGGALPRIRLRRR